MIQSKADFSIKHENMEKLTKNLLRILRWILSGDSSGVVEEKLGLVIIQQQVLSSSIPSRFRFPTCIKALK